MARQHFSTLFDHVLHWAHRRNAEDQKLQDIVAECSALCLGMAVCSLQCDWL